MNTFACIDFINNPILLPKGELLKLKRVPAYLQEKKIHKESAYHLYITKQKEQLPRRFWNKIERELVKKGVYYFISDQQELPFKEIQKVTGERIPFLLSKYILDYIFKYNLLQKDEKYVKIGVVVGQKKEALDTIGPILGKITDLTLFTKEREQYKELKEEIYKVARIKPKLFLPNKRVLSQMDIVFDAQREENYVNQCSPRAIYIDSYKNVVRRKIKINQPAPIVWDDFDIAFENTILTKELLEALLYQKGCSKRSLRKRIVYQNINILKPYVRR